MMIVQHIRLGEGGELIERSAPLTRQNLLQYLLALSRKGRGRNNARCAWGKRDPASRGYCMDQPWLTTMDWPVSAFD
jgi:hypothetical protein